VSSAKTAPIKMPFGLWTRKKGSIRWGPRNPVWRGIY